MKSLPERFWPKVAKRGPNECWEWTAMHLPRGYGIVRTARIGGIWRRDYAHRVSWSLANGPIPAGLHVLHRCDNPPCVNPAHLFVGTHAENQADKAQKGRAQRGTRVPQSKLSEADVLAIRSTPLSESSYALAPRWGVSARSIRDIRERRTWAWLGPQ